MRLQTSLIVICGPTATGKSQAAESVALRRSGVILSADSMQVYKKMDIGTAKVSIDDRRVPYYGLDLIEPDETYSAALYQTYGRKVIDEMTARDVPVIMVGGTGLYIKAVIDDMRFPAGDQKDNPIRDRYQALADAKGPQAVWDALYSQDPESAMMIHPHNTKRVVRALEMADEGKRYVDQAKGFACAEQRYPAVHIGLEMQRDRLYARINERVDAMREAGLVDEVIALANDGFAESLTARQAIGYKEIISAIAGERTMDQAFEDIKQATRRYAKRQMTWFKKDKRIRWLDVTNLRAHEISQGVEDLIAQDGRNNVHGA